MVVRLGDRDAVYGAVVPGVGVSGPKAVHVGGLAKDLSCGESGAAADLQQRRRQLLNERAELLVQGEDVLGQLATPLNERPGEPGDGAGLTGQPRQDGV